MFKNYVRKGSLVVSSLALVATMAACGDKEDKNNASGSESPAPTTEATTEAPANLSGSIQIDGSSTVFPISMAIAEEFMALNKGVKVTVGEGGSSTGIKKLIAGEIQIADSSRHMKDSEHEELKAKGEEAIEMPVAYDGITVVISKKNDWAKDITLEELNKIWAVDSKISKWSEVREGWPDKPLKLYGPGTASGTFEYFTEVVNGKAKESRSDYQASEDDNVLVKGVAGDEGGMGYFGFSYYEENMDKLDALPIIKDAAKGPVAPTVESIEAGEYPISREIYIYPLKSALAKPEVAEFIKFYMSAEGQKLIEEAKFVKLPADLYAKNLEHLK